MSFVDTPGDHGLSGGQMQRIAVARTFMRSLSTERTVGLLLFDEPSASLDPTAEQGTIFLLACTLFVSFVLKVPSFRSLLTSSRLTREQDDDILDAPIRKSNASC